MSLTTRSGVGELRFVRKHADDGTLGERAVADFAASGATHEADFADAERRKVVVQHEALGGRFAGLQQLDALLVVLGAEGDGDQRLRLAAREQGRAVGAGQQAGFDRDGADLVERAAIGTAALVEHLVAEDLLLEQVEDLARFGALLFGQRFDRALLDFGDLGVAFELGILLRVERVLQIGFAGSRSELVKVLD